MNEISSVGLSWNESGEITHLISGRFDDREKDFLLVFAPSPPLAISHQLGSLSPAFGLKLCESILRFYLYNNHARIRINKSLSRLEIVYIKTDDGITLNVNPSYIFDKGEVVTDADGSTDEGVFQLLNNYIYHVYMELMLQKQYHAHISTKQATGVAVAYYLNVLDKAAQREAISKGNLQWFPELIFEMAQVTTSIIQNFGAKYKSDADALAIDKDSDRAYKDVLNHYQQIVKHLGIKSSL